MTIYVDGVAVGSKVTALNTSASFNHVGIGVDTWWSAGYHYMCNGRVDEVKLYDYALSPAEVRRGATRALGRGARPRGGLEQRTVGPQLAEAHGREWSVRRRVAPPVAARRALVGRAASQRAGHARAPRAAILARMATAHLAGRRVVLSVVRGVVVVLESSRAFARGAIRAAGWHHLRCLLE